MFPPGTRCTTWLPSSRQVVSRMPDEEVDAIDGGGGVPKYRNFRSLSWGVLGIVNFKTSRYTYFEQ